MKKKISLFSIVIIIVFVGNCINLKIDIPEDPGWGIDFFFVSNELDPDKNFINPEMKTIYSTDNHIYSVAKILNIDETVKIRWVWYGPDNEVVKRSVETIVNKNAGFLEYFIVWDSMGRKYFEKKKGKWVVAILVNGKFFSKKDFQIN